MPPPTLLEPEFRKLGELGAIHHRSEVEPLLTGDERHADEAVLGAFDGRHFDGPADRPHLQQMGVQPLRALHRQRHRLEQRQIEVLARATRRDAPGHGERRERRERAPDVLADVTADGYRRAVGHSAKPRGATPALEGELGGRPVRPRTRPAVVGNGDDDARTAGRRLRGLEQACPARGGPARRVHHDVRAGDQVRDDGPVEFCNDAALARIQEGEQGRVHVPRQRRLRRGVPTDWIARRRFHLDHRCSGIPEQLAAVVPGDAITDLQHPIIRQWRRPGHWIF